MPAREQSDDAAAQRRHAHGDNHRRTIIFLGGEIEFFPSDRIAHQGLVAIDPEAVSRDSPFRGEVGLFLWILRHKRSFAARIAALLLIRLRKNISFPDRTASSCPTATEWINFR